MERGAVHLSVVCPRCGTMNNLTIVNVRDDERVTCSHCGADIGRTAELKPPLSRSFRRHPPPPE